MDFDEEMRVKRSELVEDHLVIVDIITRIVVVTMPLAEWMARIYFLHTVEVVGEENLVVGGMDEREKIAVDDIASPRDCIENFSDIVDDVHSVDKLLRREGFRQIPLWPNRRWRWIISVQICAGIGPSNPFILWKHSTGSKHEIDLLVPNVDDWMHLQRCCFKFFMSDGDEECLVSKHAIPQFFESRLEVLRPVEEDIWSIDLYRVAHPSHICGMRLPLRLTIL